MVRMNSIRIAAKHENLGKLLDAVSNFSDQNDLSSDVVRKIQLTIEEAVINIINYAYPEKVGEVEICYQKENDDQLIVEIRDNGIPFDPLSAPEPDLTAKLIDRKVGGLGVFFIRKMTEDVYYRRQGDANILTLVFSG